MHFEESFFEGGYRNGFYVSGMMKRNWAAQLEVLEEIKRICKKHNIRYFADWGTLLGAVRHKGFVPWDDDMDLGMTREDFQRFLVVAPKELPEGYKLLSIHTEEAYEDMLMRVVNSTEVSYSDAYLEKNHGCPYAIGMDIFPVDYVPRNPDDWEFQRSMIMATLATANHIKAGTITDEDLEEIIEGIQEVSGIQIERGERTIRKQLMLLTEAFLALYTEEEADMVASMTDLARGSHRAWSKHCYDEIVEVPFENTTIAIPAGYDEVLKAKYGDYMRMVRGWDSHKYPCYRHQEEILRKHFEEQQITPPPILKKELDATKRYMDKPIPVEIDDFARIRQNDYYYVDKTDFIREFCEHKHKLWLVNKPERFGKTLWFVTLANYITDVFDVSGAVIEDKTIFEDTKISNTTFAMGEFVGVGFWLKYATYDTFEETIASLMHDLTYLFKMNSFITNSPNIKPEDLEAYATIFNGDGDVELYKQALGVFIRCIAATFGKKVVFVLEDYDILLSNAYRHGYYEELLSFIKALLQNATKEECVEHVLMLAKYGIASDILFEDIDDIYHISQLDANCEQFFGYTEEEVKDMFTFFDMEEYLDLAKEWFGGYGLQKELYNPWSINNFVASVCNGAKEPFTFWTEASIDKTVTDLMKKYAGEMKQEIQTLLDGGYILKYVHREINYDSLYQDVDEVWNYLVLTGHVVAHELKNEGQSQIAKLIIPNEECRRFFERALNSCK